MADARLPVRLGVYGATVADWNSATSNGFHMGNAAANAPTALGWYFGYVEAHNDLYMTQTVHGFITDAPNDTKAWRRDMNNGTWSAWYRLRISEAELDARYAGIAFARAIASQAEAEAGSDNATVMTPLRTAQAIAALAGGDQTPFALTDAATVAVDWAAAENYTLALGGNRTLGLPTNGIPGTRRRFMVSAVSSTRQLTLTTNFRGETDLVVLTSGQGQLLTVYCHSSSVFVIEKQTAAGAI